MSYVSYELIGTSNPGWTFTEERIIQLNNMYSIMKNINSQLSYKDFRKIINEKDNDLNPSKIRMFFPHLYQLGFIKEYQSIKFIPSKLFTKEGFYFFNYIIPIFLNREELELKAKKIVEEIFSMFLCKGYLNLIESEEKREYDLIMKFLKKYQTMDKIDFFIVTTGVANEKEDGYIDELLNKKRKGTISFSDDIKKNVNAYGYITPFLVQSKLISINNDIMRLGINSKYIWRWNFGNIRKGY